MWLLIAAPVFLGMMDFLGIGGLDDAELAARYLDLDADLPFCRLKQTLFVDFEGAGHPFTVERRRCSGKRRPDRIGELFMVRDGKRLLAVYPVDETVMFLRMQTVAAGAGRTALFIALNCWTACAQDAYRVLAWTDRGPAFLEWPPLPPPLLHRKTDCDLQTRVEVVRHRMLRDRTVDYRDIVSCVGPGRAIVSTMVPDAKAGVLRLVTARRIRRR